ncbi:MAG TPA: DnaJ domain-containing protein [Patescibacteria group bacterium]|nr:DnaJ domain-containing protein [Patescibacteria group bacterium]
MVKADYYSILEAWPTSSIDDIKKNYFRLAKLYHPDVAGDIPENRERFKLINEAYSVLSDPQKRHEYDEQLRKSHQSSRSSVAIQEKDRRSAALAFTQAKEAIRQGRYDKAALLLKSAIKYDSTRPAYYSWYGFSLAMLNTRLHDARDACKKALQMEFYNADYHANLGFVYFKAGLKSLAIKHFNDALRWDPQSRVANKYIDLAKGREGGDAGPITRFFSAVKEIFEFGKA